MKEKEIGNKRERESDSLTLCFHCKRSRIDHHQHRYIRVVLDVEGLCEVLMVVGRWDTVEDLKSVQPERGGKLQPNLVERVDRGVDKVGCYGGIIKRVDWVG